MKRISIDADKFCKVTNFSGDEFLIVNGKTPKDNLIRTVLFYEYNQLDITVFNPKYDEIEKDVVEKDGYYIWKNNYKVPVKNYSGIHEIKMTADETERYRKGYLKLAETTL